MARRWMIHNAVKRFSIRFQTSDHVTVTVERGGQKQDISLTNIAQVASQATKELDAGDSPPAGATPNGTPPPPSSVPGGSNENPNE